MRRRLPTGIDRVCLRYARRFPDARAVVRMGAVGRVLSRDRSRALFSLLSTQPAGLVRRLPALMAGGMLAPVQRLGADSVFFNVGHSGLHRESYVNWLGQSGLRPVFMVHDLIPITHPEYARDGERHRHEQRVAAMLRLGRGLIANSMATLDALRAYARERGLAMPAATVAPLAGADLPAGDPVPLLDGPYFVMLGTIEPRKNHAMMLQIWREMASRGGPVPRLVLIGQRGWNVEHVYGLLDRCGGLGPLVVLRPDCGDAELATWLRHARALVPIVRGRIRDAAGGGACDGNPRYRQRPRGIS